MLKANKKTLIITSIITLLPIITGLVLWDRLPDVMATHFNMNSTPDGFSSKAFTVFGIPLFLLGMHLLCVFCVSQDPRKSWISPKIFKLVLWIVPVVTLFCMAVIYPYNLGMSFDVSLTGQLLLGFIFVVMGNYLPKVRQNYTIGIRVPWTLANEENWNRTHRLSGFLWVTAGIIILIGTFAGLHGMWLLIGILLVATLVPVVYSVYLHAAKGM